MESTLYADAGAALDALTVANQAFVKRYPGDRPDRQPVHTVYGGAHLFTAETPRKLGELAMRALDAHAHDAFAFARAVALPGSEGLGSHHVFTAQSALFQRDPQGLREADPAAWLAFVVYDRVRRKLQQEAVEDFRIDFEDGFGNRPDPEEDAAAIRAAREVARGLAAGLLPPFIGIRIKPLNDEMKVRSIRTLDLFITTLVEHAGSLPPGFVVTLPKIMHPGQVTALVRLFERLEERLQLRPGTLRLELMIELTQSILAPDGRSMLPRLLDAAEGRCFAAHFGTYDYTASYGITAAWQTMDHPACRAALDQMKLAFAGTGVFLSDGATNVMPVAPHREGPGGGPLTGPQREENDEVVHGAWRTAASHTRGSLIQGFYQGWDLHPAQLPVRYATCYAFFLEGFQSAAERLKSFLDKAFQATLVGDIFDDAATGQGLLNYFLRALNCGAVSLDELAATGLTVDEIQTRSFLKILDGRRGQ
ncbi:MAG: phosphoenolpyruvate kinase [Myxococcales bacterium]|nr:phosphoenolpyruvate kinase [Myxococcales bacterium]